MADADPRKHDESRTLRLIASAAAFALAHLAIGVATGSALALLWFAAREWKWVDDSTNVGWVVWWVAPLPIWVSSAWLARHHRRMGVAIIGAGAATLGYACSLAIVNDRLGRNPHHSLLAAVVWTTFAPGLFVWGISAIASILSACSALGREDWMASADRCGGCGYSREGLGMGRCPECGRDA